MSFVMRKAHAEQLPELYAIMNAAEQETAGKQIFVPEPPPYLENHIARDGFTLVAMHEDVAAGFLCVDLPGGDPRNLAFDLGWPPEQAKAAAIMDIAAVLPEYRGHGLQKRFLTMAEEMLAGMSYTSFLATVSPDNPPSLNSFRVLGYLIGATKPKYGGQLRHILYKRIPER